MLNSEVSYGKRNSLRLKGVIQRRVISSGCAVFVYERVACLFYMVGQAMGELRTSDAKSQGLCAAR